MILGMFIIVLMLTAPGLYGWSLSQLQQTITIASSAKMDSGFFIEFINAKLLQSLVILVPFLVGAAAASVMASLASSGWAFSTKAISLKLERISPINGFKNLLSLKSLVHLLISLAKLTVILVILYVYLHDKMDRIMTLRWAELDGTMLETGRLVFGVLSRIVIGLVIIAGIDLLYQRWNYKKELRMTRQEVKEERKQYELAPEVKGRMRAIQIQMAKQRMLQEVPNADVVLANPTHVAVAIKYDSAKMDAPMVIAKGPDLLAQQIKELARKNGVPVVHRPELARAVYKAVDIGRTIPDTLFVAVAEVLAMIYRTKRQITNDGRA